MATKLSDQDDMVPGHKIIRTDNKVSYYNHVVTCTGSATEMVIEW